MSARDALHDRMHGVGYCDPPCGLCKEVSGLLDDFAHELAEQQRQWAREHGVMLEDERYVTAGDVIDLIDPDVGPVRPGEEPTT
jgi:hypothetical protein